MTHISMIIADAVRAPKWTTLQQLVREVTRTSGVLTKIDRTDGGCDYTAAGLYQLTYEHAGTDMTILLSVVPPQVDTFGWERQLHTECDRCHSELWCCSVDFGDGGGHWDYCQECWRRLSEQGALESNNWV